MAEDSLMCRAALGLCCMLAAIAFARAADEPIFEPGAMLKVEAEGGVGGEGPAWHPELGVLSSGNGRVCRLTRDGKSVVFNDKLGTNGLLFDRQGRLLACDSAGRRMIRLERDGTL